MRGVRPYAVSCAANPAGAAVRRPCPAAGLPRSRLRPGADTVSGAVAGTAPATGVRFRSTRTWGFRGGGRVGSWTG
ncbi:hypothetical protein GCM10010266_12830 [Streptomyces griseomycini]|nr:hypothetical protein GCM10010266_12830 [Streptomyces griseomycini]GGR14110.1 hypothetical protein GCM10015536_19810 [Streptomyces griseomycini]